MTPRVACFCLAALLFPAQFAFADLSAEASAEADAKCGSAEDVIRALYGALLARDADPEGLDFHVRKLTSGITVRRVALEIALDPSGEVKRRLTQGKDARQTVELAYQSFLGRPLGPGESGSVEAYQQDGVKAYEFMVHAIFHSYEYAKAFGEDIAPHDRRTEGVKYCP